MTKRLSFLIAVLLATCAIPTLATAQTIRQLTRATAATGANDSLVFAVSDSAARTRGVSGAELKLMLSRGTVFDSLRSPLVRASSGVYDSVRVNGGIANYSAAATTFSIKSGAASAFVFSDGTTSWLNLDTRQTTSGQWQARWMLPDLTLASTSGQHAYPFLFSAGIQSYTGTTALTGTLAAATAPVAFQIGRFKVNATTATALAVAEAANVNIQGPALAEDTAGGGTLTITRSYGLKISTQAATGTNGVVTTAFGLRAEAPTTAATNLAASFDGNVTHSAASRLYLDGDANGLPGNTYLSESGADTVTFTTGGSNSLSVLGGATGKILGGAGNFIITAGTGASRTLTLQSTNASSAAVNTAVLAADTSTTFLGRVIAPATAIATPSHVFTGFTTSGVSHTASGDTVGIAVGGAAVVQFPSAGKIVGIAGNMTVTAGTGNSRTMTLQTTTSSGVVKNNLVLGADSSTTSLGTITSGSGIYKTVLSDFANGRAATFGDGTLQPIVAINGNSTAGQGPTLVFQKAGSNMGIIGPQSAVTLSGTSSNLVIGPVQSGDSLVLSTGGSGTRSLLILGGASPTLVGGAGNMTVLSGTGASRTMTLQTTNSSSTAINTLVLGADSSVTALGKIVPNATKGIVGTTTNDNAVAGSTGEYMSHSTAAAGVALTTNTTANIDSLTLTAGDWDVYGVVDFRFGATTSYTNLAGGVSSTTATLATDQGFDFEIVAQVPTATKDQAWGVSPVRFSLSGTTKVYLVAQGTFTVSTLSAYGSIRARRAR
jgi:hypothetical protein